jgi:hypothetical protein
MNSDEKSLSELIEKDEPSGSVTFAGVKVNKLLAGTLNIRADQDGPVDLNQNQLDAFRSVLAGAGYRETKSWKAWEGVSWMSRGAFAGVSMRVEKV